MNDATEVNNALTKREGRVTMASDKERTTEKGNDKSSVKVSKAQKDSIPNTRLRVLNLSF
jgi:hypothetical protein